MPLPTCHLRIGSHRYIQWATREGIIGGYPDNTFKPSNFVTRGQVSKMIMNGFSFELIDPPTAHFADVPHGSTFYTYIETAYSNNIIAGYQGDPDHWNTCLSTPGYEALLVLILSLVRVGDPGADDEIRGQQRGSERLAYGA